MPLACRVKRLVEASRRMYVVYGPFVKLRRKVDCIAFVLRSVKDKRCSQVGSKIGGSPVLALELWDWFSPRWKMLSVK